MGTKKKPRISAPSGEVNVARSLEDSRTGEELAAESGQEVIDVGQIEGPVAEASGLRGMTWPTDVRFKMLRIDCGGRLPCSIEDFVSGKAHARLHNILQRELEAQYKRGMGGL